MYSESKIVLMLFLALFVSCSQYRALEKIRDGQVSLNLAIAQEQVEDTVTESVLIDSIRSSLTDEPLIMKAIKDTETGEMVATDVIRASRVVAKFRNVAERAGYVTVSFDICVPSEMSSSEWQLKVFPFMAIQQDTVALEPVFITGEKYRGRQMRGYEKYQEFLSSIITDPNDFLRMGQLEIFLQRHFPETYAMKSDTSFIAEPMAENLFGVTQRDAFEHYRKDLKWRSNERRKGRVEEMYDKYVKDPI